MARRPRENHDEEQRFQDDSPVPPPKDSPDWKFYNATCGFAGKVQLELEGAREEKLPEGITMAQTEARHKRIHLLELVEKKLEKIKKIWNGDPTPDLPMTE